MKLSELGWSEFFQEPFSRFTESGDAFPGRVVAQQRGELTVRAEHALMHPTVSGRMRFEAQASSALPVVGDWVVVEAQGEAIVGCLPRRSAIMRKVSGARAEAQVVAANVDLVFIVMGLDDDFNLRRLERGLHMVWDSGAAPTVILNKADLCPDWQEWRDEVQALARVPVIVSSLVDPSEDFDALPRVRRSIAEGETAALIGSSGVGKSTLLNGLVGEGRLVTQPVRARDGRGQHTTTHRELFFLKGAGMLIDNPGMREIQLWGSDDSLDKTFSELSEFTGRCRFADCEHESEPGCAVQQALVDGTLEPARWESYSKLKRELHYVHRRQDQGLARLEREKWKKIHKDMRQRGHRRT